MYCSGLNVHFWWFCPLKLSQNAKPRLLAIINAQNSLWYIQLWYTEIIIHLSSYLVHHIVDRKKSSVFAICEKMVRQYELRGFIVKHMWIDNKFKPLRDDLLSIGVTLYIGVANEHASLM